MEYLYHYTTVDTLALILKNKTFRLNNLADMDDLEEGSTADAGKYGRHVYTSSWCDNPKESIPLWNLYTSNMQGVRIAMPKNIFETQILQQDGIEIKEDVIYTKGLLDIQEKNNIMFMPTVVDLFKVEYTHDESLLYPNIIKITESDTPGMGTATIITEKIGVYKRSSWSFQDEWRYRVKALPFNKHQLLEIQQESMEEGKGVLWILGKILDENIETLKYIDLQISDNAFNQMEILCGPKMTAGQKLIVGDLVEKYNPLAKIKHSNLKVR